MSIRLLTFETFARKKAWFTYWQNVKPWNETLWLDRSPCSEPFFDPLHVNTVNHYPTIGGICRPNLKLQVGDWRVYVAQIDPKIPPSDLAPYVNPNRWPLSNNINGLYAVVAVLEIVHVYPSHLCAEKTFAKGRPEVLIPGQPAVTSPPNLLVSNRPDHTVPRGWCIAYAGNKPYLPNNAGYDDAYAVNVREYYGRAMRQSFAVCKAHYISLERPTVVTGTDLLRWAPTPNPKYPAGNVSGRIITQGQLCQITEACC